MPHAPKHPAALSSADAASRAEALTLLRVTLPFTARALDSALTPASDVSHARACAYGQGVVSAVRAAAAYAGRVETPTRPGHVPPSEAARAVVATLDAVATPALAYAEADDTAAGREALRTVAREAEACAKALRAALGSDGA
jgi:hypothetical protein